MQSQTCSIETLADIYGELQKTNMENFQQRLEECFSTFQQLTQHLFQVTPITGVTGPVGTTVSQSAAPISASSQAVMSPTTSAPAITPPTSFY